MLRRHINMDKLALYGDLNSVFVLESLTLFREELEQAKFTLSNWQNTASKHAIQQMLWCLRGTCASFGAAQLQSRVENAHHALNAVEFMDYDLHVGPAFLAVLQIIDETLLELNMLETVSA
ncbi:MAG: hypothetical protein H7A01_14205 [Hahellaceae bacterium]|nr:hypothetical protein [Hahellaceae bacterium]MCP5210209.1 hypothetical protein [Hahellaceae bacterium]